MEDMKFINAQQAKQIYYLKNLKTEWRTWNSSMPNKQNEFTT